MRNGNTSVDIVESGEFRLVERRHYQHIRSGLEIAWDRTRWRWVTSDGVAFLVLYDAVAWLRQSLQAVAKGADDTHHLDALARSGGAGL